jgi:quinolinate synthase
MTTTTQPARPAPLPYTREVAAKTAERRDRLRGIIPEVEWEIFAPYIAAIDDLKRERDAVILAHNYQTPEIYHGVADIVGDSLALAYEATHVEARTIVLAGVHFMAETAKLVNPAKTVLIPDVRAGCSLAESITAADVRLLRESHPGVPIVTYVNTSAEVKAESDICCTSGNAVHIVESLGVPKAIVIPDRFLAAWVETQTSVEIITWKGACEVHERFTGQELRDYRESNPGITILAHPECPPDVLSEADFVGSTAGLIEYVGGRRPSKVVMITECSMSDNVAVNFPEIEFVRPCNLCPHMKRITLEKILRSLQTMECEVTIDPLVADRARLAVERMIAVGRPGVRR